MVFYKVKDVKPLPEYCLLVNFISGGKKKYDVKPLFKKLEPFQALIYTAGLFEQVKVDKGGYGISWNDEIDLSCNELYENGTEMKYMEHFGVRLVKRKYSFYLNREEFALINTKPSLPVFESLVQRNAYTDDKCTEYRKEWCEEYRKLCLRNFDLNMKYFSLLNRTDFENIITIFLKKHRGFRKVNSLLDLDGTSGYYIMILDKYKQAYIGKSNNIKKRIQNHWSHTKAFDRTLFPMYAVDKSCFSIDFFRALDTTRIFVWKKDLSDGIERILIEDFPKKYCTNRIGGDISLGIEALATLNERNLE